MSLSLTEILSETIILLTVKLFSNRVIILFN